MDKRQLSERDICTKYITPAIDRSGWDVQRQVREEVTFTDGRVIERGAVHKRGKQKRADYVLFYKPNLPLAIIEAKTNAHAVGAGMQQALDYAEVLDIPFVYASNGDAFIEHDRTGQGDAVEREIPLGSFPSPDELWQRYRTWKGLSDVEVEVVLQDYYTEAGGKEPGTTSASRSTAWSRPSRKGRSACSSSWPPGPGRRTRPSRPSGGCGRRNAPSASCSWPTATSWSTWNDPALADSLGV